MKNYIDLITIADNALNVFAQTWDNRNEYPIHHPLDMRIDEISEMTDAINDKVKDMRSHLEGWKEEIFVASFVPAYSIDLSVDKVVSVFKKSYFISARGLEGKNHYIEVGEVDEEEVYFVPRLNKTFPPGTHKIEVARELYRELKALGQI